MQVLLVLQSNALKFTTEGRIKISVGIVVVESDSENTNKYVEISLAHSEVPANWSGQFSLSGHIVLHWAAASLKGLVEFEFTLNRTEFDKVFQCRLGI